MSKLDQYLYMDQNNFIFSIHIQNNNIINEVKSVNTNTLILLSQNIAKLEHIELNFTNIDFIKKLVIILENTFSAPKYVDPEYKHSIATHLQDKSYLITISTNNISELYICKALSLMTNSFKVLNTKRINMFHI